MASEAYDAQVRDQIAIPPCCPQWRNIVNKFAVLAASLVASFALAFAVYSAESNANSPRSPQVVASIRLTDQTQTIPGTTIFNVKETGLYRVTTYMAMTAP